jgi:hypothetical protein
VEERGLVLGVSPAINIVKKGLFSINKILIVEQYGIEDHNP